jgi:GntR family phosphonate transport system transcriptional regulator
MAEIQVDAQMDGLPLFKRISNLLDEEITKFYKPGDVLPTELDLAKRFQVNRHTVRRAISELMTIGKVGTLPGKGTVVQQKVINYSIHSTTKFTETLESCGRLAESLVLRKNGIPAVGEVAEMLELEQGQPVILVETLRKMDGSPFSLGSHFLPLDKLFMVMRAYNGGSLHDFILQHYGFCLRRKISLISAVLPTQGEVELLQIAAMHPLLRVKSVNVNQHTGEPLELVISRFKGGSTQLSIEPHWTADL